MGGVLPWYAHRGVQVYGGGIEVFSCMVLPWYEVFSCTCMEVFSCVVVSSLVLTPYAPADGYECCECIVVLLCPYV